MQPRSPRYSLACLAVGLLAGSAAVHADQDVNLTPVDVAKMLKDLHALKDKQAIDAKGSKTAAISQLQAAVGSIPAGIAFWENGVRATQMDGGGKENEQFRAWQNTEGELFKERLVQNAVHLHLEWLLITLQRSNGATVKDLLPTILNYTKELLADQAEVEAFVDAIKKEKEGTPGVMKQRGGRNPGQQDAKADEAIKKTHDSILRTNLASSMIVSWLKLDDAVALDKWELNPAAYDGIYNKIIQPELRTERDARVFEYWDTKLKKEADAATKTRLSFEVDKYNSQRRPELLWNRAQEYTYLGQKNRALTEMFGLIKQFPTHPSATDWASALEAALAPPAPDAATTSATPALAPGLPTAAPTAAAPVVTPLPPPVSIAPASGPTPTALLPGAQ